jgi:hypothetical protein
MNSYLLDEIMNNQSFSTELLREAYDAADIGGTLTLEKNSYVLESLYEMSNKTILSDEDKTMLKYELSKDRELYLERLLRNTPCYMAFLHVWLVDKAKNDCKKKYTQNYHTTQRNGIFLGLGLTVLFLGSIFGAGILVAKYLL